MTAPAVVKRPALFLVPLAVGAVVAVALGVYGKNHHPTGHALFFRPFPSMFAMKVWLTAGAVVLAFVQLFSALRMWGKIGRGPAPAWIGPLHRTSGIIAFLLTLPVAFHCLWSIGFMTPDARVIAHCVLGCVFYGAFVTKILTLHSKRLPGWALPWAGGFLFTALIGVGFTSAGWYFATIGIPG